MRNSFIDQFVQRVRAEIDAAAPFIAYIWEDDGARGTGLVRTGALQELTCHQDGLKCAQTLYKCKPLTPAVLARMRKQLSALAKTHYEYAVVDCSGAWPAITGSWAVEDELKARLGA